MTEKDLKKLNRYQLLEMLIIQTERADELERKLEEAQQKLDSRDVQMTVMGSIAEASLQLSGIIYLKAAKEQAAEAERILEEARQKAQRILQAAERNACIR